MVLVPDARIATLVAGVLTLAAGFVIVGIAPRAPLHRATGLFFGLRGGFLTLVAFSQPTTDLEGRLSVYLLIAIPFAAVWMAYCLAHDFGRRRRATQHRTLTLGLLVFLVALELWYGLDHSMFFGSPGHGRLYAFFATQGRGPFYSFFSIQFLTYAAIAWAIARELSLRAAGPSRRALYTFMLGFAGEPLYWASNLIVQRLRGVDLPAATMAFPILVVALLAAALGWTARLGRTERAPAIVLVLVAVGTGLLSALPAARSLAPPHVLDLRTLNAVWTLWTVAATAYASLRYRLFGMDLQVKAFLRYGSTTFLLAMVFWAANEILEGQLHANNTWQSLAAAAAVGITLWPLQRAMQRLAERLMPGVARTEEYRRRRREDIYVAAVERARRDGFVDTNEREALRMLGHGLGLSGRDMERLEEPTTGGFRPSAA